ncbi:NUDIX domain-containing protein [Escherichia coli]
MGPAIASALLAISARRNQPAESAEQAMYRELFEEVGLSRKDVRSLLQRVTGCATIKTFGALGHEAGLNRPKTKMVSLAAGERGDAEINMQTSSTPEFDGWRWVSYWYPVRQVVDLNVMSTVG